MNLRQRFFVAPTTTTATKATGTRNRDALVSLNMVGAKTIGSRINAHRRLSRPRNEECKQHGCDADQEDRQKTRVGQRPDRSIAGEVTACKRSQTLIERDRQLRHGKSEHEQQLCFDLPWREEHDGRQEEERNGAQVGTQSGENRT